MSRQASEIQFSFIIPVYNSGAYLIECLDSVVHQNFSHSQLELIIIDDCSTDQLTLDLLKELSTTDSYKGIYTKVIFNPKNLWSAETRNIGVKASKGRYIVCLDSDDTIEPDFLTYSSLAFAAYPNASWVYPSVRKFGYRNKIDIAPDFSAKKLFINNYLVITSPMKREVWESLGGQKSIQLYNKIKLFEDWDFWQRALAKKYFGVPIKKVFFNYRQTLKSNISRTEEEGNLTTILSYRQNWKSIFGIRGSQNNFNKTNHKFSESAGILSKIIILILRKTIGRSPLSFRLSDFVKYLIFPSQLVKKRLNKKNTFTKAHKMAGFKRGFTFKDDTDFKTTALTNRTVLCTHFWWHIGGAENILLDYMREIKKMDFKLVDVVMDSMGPASTIKDRFSEVADFQFELDTVADGPYPRLLALWELIKREKPAIILNMSNPLLYLLTPVIKEKLPNTVIYDLLHCEEFEDNGWFEAAYFYQKYIDKRIVTSHFWKDVLIQKYNESAHKIEIIYNMIDYDKFKNEPINRDAKLKSFGIDPSKKVIGFLGRFHEQKRPDIFVQLAESMQGKSDFHFIMAGDGPELENLLPRIKALPNLTYVGATKNPEKIFTAFDVAIFPSKFEGYPLVGIECAQIKLPIIAANIVGFNEIVNNGNAGMLYDVKQAFDDVNSMANILLEKYDELIQLGENGPAFVDAFHNESFIKQEIKRVFSKVG
jgi:glycosyltransferase involved in cell wall biosynthesis